MVQAPEGAGLCTALRPEVKVREDATIDNRLAFRWHEPTILFRPDVFAVTLDRHRGQRRPGRHCPGAKPHAGHGRRTKSGSKIRRRMAHPHWEGPTRGLPLGRPGVGDVSVPFRSSIRAMVIPVCAAHATRRPKDARRPKSA